MTSNTLVVDRDRRQVILPSRPERIPSLDREPDSPMNRHYLVGPPLCDPSPVAFARKRIATPTSITAALKGR